MLLAIDTSAGTAVALAAEGRVIAQRSTEDSMRHAELVGVHIADVLAEAGVTSRELEGVVAGMGPGPFTGLRVGIAAARAFAFGAGLPLLPLVSHDAIAFEHFRAPASSQSAPDSDPRGLSLSKPDAGSKPDAASAPDMPAPLTVITDARRREKFWSQYEGLTSDAIPLRTRGPELAKPADVPVSGEMLEASTVSAGALALLAEAHLAAGVAFARPEPLYLRSPDVTIAAGRKRVTQ